MNNRVALISQSEYARRRGVAKSAVAKAVAENRISLIDGKIDPGVADIQWAQNTRARADGGHAAGSSEGKAGQAASQVLSAVGEPDARAPAGAAAEPGYHDFRARREKADAERAERENLRDAGRLVDRDSTERAIFDAFRQLRDAVMASSQRAAPKLIGMADVRDAEMVIADELRKAFAGWETRMLERLPPVEKT